MSNNSIICTFNIYWNNKALTKWLFTSLLTGTDKFTASLPLPDGVPTGEVSVGAHDGDTAYDGVGTGAVETGVVAGQEGLHVSVCLHVILTVWNTAALNMCFSTSHIARHKSYNGKSFIKLLKGIHVINFCGTYFNTILLQVDWDITIQISAQSKDTSHINGLQWDLN